ncbi:MAG: hypothetical protein ABF261_02260 [Candidatus Arcticimaribacter sp.]|jgi:hypothetical protein
MYKLTEEQRKQLVNYLAKRPYAEVAVLVGMIASLPPITDQGTANKIASETTKEGREKIANLAIQKRNNAQNDLS